MSNVTVKLVLRANKKRADGTAPVYLRVTQARRARYVSTGVFVEPRQWNPEKQEVRKGRPLAKKQNERLKDQKLKAERAALSEKTAEAVLATIDTKGGTFSTFLDAFISDLETSGRFWDWKKFKVTRGKIEEALGEGLAWAQLDRAALVKLERHMREKLGNAPNTVRKEMSRVRRVIRQAIKEGRLAPNLDPFVSYDLPKGQPVKRRRLTMEEIEKLANVDLPLGDIRRTVRDLYLFSFYAAGLRISDALRLERSAIQEGRVEYRMLKTGHLQSVKLPARALRIVEPYLEGEGPYLFPLLRPGNDKDPINLRRRIASITTIVNEELKQAAKAAGVEDKGLSTHTARHSFADHARKSGDLYAVSKALGHSDLQTTQTYLSAFDRAAVDNLTDNLWGEDE